MSTIGSRIRNMRQAAGLSVDDLAAKIGKNRATVYRYESDDIENFPVSVIPALADALHTTPAYLMGWASAGEDEWMSAFRDSLNFELSQTNQSDAADAGVDLHYLSEIADGSRSLSLSDACKIADELGCSLDAMVGLADGNERTRKEPATVSDDGPNAVKSRIIALLDTMTEDQLEKLLAVIDMIHKPQE